VFRLDLASRRVERFTPPDIKIPNYPVIDAVRNRLLVSDSHDFANPGPGVWAYDLAIGAASLWYDRPMVFANGMALVLDGASLYVCETFARRITRIATNPDGGAGAATPFALDLPGLPDGIAFDRNGCLFCGCYEPSRILRISPSGDEVDIYIEDPTAHLFAHPTNIVSWSKQPLEGFESHPINNRWVGGSESPNFLGWNRNKRSMAVNLKSPDAKTILYRIGERADVVVQNFRPGVLAKLGFGYDDFRAINPRIIYCSGSGYGESGPYLSRPGQDMLIQGLTGIAAATGRGDGPPVPVGSGFSDRWRGREDLLVAK